MVAVVDVYDALTSDRCYHDGIATDVALARLYDWSEKELDSKLVERFIESMGVFPVGSLVLLSDDSVAVVDSLNRNYPAHPVVRLLLHTDGSTLLQSRLENLANHRQDPQGLRILRTLPPGSQGLHPAELIRRA
jgi:hypothetical protein